MLKPELPASEQLRLSTLKSLNLLDTPADERFDRVVRLAKGSFNVSMALISLVDEDRQWFKSSFGLEAKQTPRDVSFCGHTILEPDILYIEDARKDERFSDNPLVTGEPFIRFYVGCPLRAPNGEAIGTLCLADQLPRKFSEAEKQELIHFTRLIEAELLDVRANTMDDHTLISNKAGLLDLARYSLTRCAKSDVPVSLVIIDIEPSKAASAKQASEATLIVTNKLKANLRDLDILSRISDTRFAMLLANCEVDEVDMLFSVYLGAAKEVLSQHLLDDVVTIKTQAEPLNSKSDDAMKRLAQL